MNVHVHTVTLTSKLKEDPLKGTVIFTGSLLRYHVSFSECFCLGQCFSCYGLGSVIMFSSGKYICVQIGGCQEVSMYHGSHVDSCMVSMWR